MRIEDIDTPALLVDVEKVKENIERAQKYADQHGFKLRPHIKTHKLPQIAKLQLDAGACGINCQKVSEAKALVEGLGPSISVDVLITFNIVGRQKLRNLIELSEMCSKLTVVADNAQVVEGYIDAASKKHRPGFQPLFNVMVECDTGGLRAGVTQPAQALAIAKQIIAGGPAIAFGGLMTYPASGAIPKLTKWLETAQELFKTAGIAIPDITVGGTPDLWNSHKIGGGVTEIRPGTYIYNDRAIVSKNAAEYDWCAATVLTTVVGRPTPTRAVCDAGSKALSSDLLGLDGFGHIMEYPNARIDRISEEHGVIEAASPADLPQIGECIRIIPNHACVVTNLFDNVHAIDQGDVNVLPIPARGKTQ